ncbi:hypothetical protein QL285_026929 [Trifolium repens]|nr:hypothetical protein QL285_026929 [Trifolium repens]
MAQKTKSRKGKEVESSSNDVPNFGLREEEFVHKDCVTTYTQYCRTRSILPQKSVNTETLRNLGLNDIAEILENEQLDTFCDLQTKYNDTLVRIFYAGLQERNGAEFEFRWGRKTYRFSANMWFDLFGMSTGSRITGEDLLAYTEASQVDYDSNVFISSITRNGNVPETMGTGKLTWNARVIYIVRNSSRVQGFGYCSLIATILRKFKVGQNFPIEYTTLGRLQKFSDTQMAKMNWTLNVDNVYVYNGQEEENVDQAAAPRVRRQRRNARQGEGDGEGQGEEGKNWNEMMGMLRNMSMQQTTFYNEYTQNYQIQNARIEELYTNTNDLRTYVTTRFDEMQAQMHGYYQPNPLSNPDNMDE